MNMDVTSLLARWSQLLAGMAQTGLAFTTNPYDAERYKELLRLAAEMTATINSQARLDPTLADQLAATWRRQVMAGFEGYATPKVGAGAIVFNTHSELLLVHSAVQQSWFLPVGMADIGYTPSEVVRKEVLEEAGLQVTPTRLVGVADSFRQGSNPSVHIYTLFFECRVDGGELRPQTQEILEAAFFGRSQLPEPLVGFARRWVQKVFDWHAGGESQTLFD